MDAVYSTGDQDAEPGARLTCHLLLRLFQTVNVLPGSAVDSSKNALYIKSTCDRHLLESSHNTIPVGAVLAILKAMLVLGTYLGGSYMIDKDQNLFSTICVYIYIYIYIYILPYMCIYIYMYNIYIYIYLFIYTDIYTNFKEIIIIKTG